ncbi:hypothetical protein [Rhodococcus sp. 06-1460-1B]|uniref:hypothetical protein n=1 Tax=Rhodococcus sp. 06-1460-1B TaxID=2022501 RepID=UPI0011405B62|nr:hypothetical protein [Rhodococcus sp. 06-1460-1B]MBY4226743.1 hypothetical protein [Rhodococcus fascians]
MTRRPPPQSVTVLAALIAFNVVSTTIHYTHNFVMADDYPPVIFFPNSLAYQIGIVIFYPLLTGLGIWGFTRYRAGRMRHVATALIAYAMLGFTSPGHFFGGIPDVPAFFMATIATDFGGGLALLVFAALVATRSLTLTDAAVDAGQRSADHAAGERA